MVHNTVTLLMTRRHPMSQPSLSSNFYECFCCFFFKGGGGSPPHSKIIKDTLKLWPKCYSEGVFLFTQMQHPVRLPFSDTVHYTRHVAHVITAHVPNFATKSLKYSTAIRPTPTLSRDGTNCSVMLKQLILFNSSVRRSKKYSVII